MRVVLDGVAKSFGRMTVLSQVNLDEDVRALALIGPSGGGKSTLLRIMGGLLEPTAGTVALGGVRLPNTERERVAFRRTLGFVFQQGGLFDHLSARENIALPLALAHGIPREDARRRADELLARLGLAEVANYRPAALSGGQRQRVAIARAVAPKPRLLLLDEPTSALDPGYTGEVLDVVAELKAEGVDFVIVTHEMGFARRACDTVAFLCDGTIKEHGESAAVFERPQTPELRGFLARMLEWR